jgi:hypothetical protein
VPTRESDRFAFQQTLDDRRCLRQPFDPGGSPIKGQPGLVIFRLDAAGAQPELQPPIRQEVDRSGFTRDQHGMAQIVVEDVGADPKVRCRLGGAD